MGGSLCWSRGRSPPPEEEGATICEELTSSPIPCLSAQLGEEDIEKIGSENELGRREQWREVVLGFGVTSHYSTPI